MRPLPEEPERFGAWRPTFTFAHGDAVLLDLALEFRFAAEEVEGWLERDVPSESYGEVTIYATRCDVDRDFHAVVVCTLEERVEREEGDGAGPAAQLDVFVLAGPGGVELVRRVGPAGGYGWDEASMKKGSLPSAFIRKALLGMVHPMGGPPEKGIGYHVSSRIWPSWSRRGGGDQGHAYQPPRFTATTEQYSIRMHLETKDKPPSSPSGHLTRTSETSHTYTWNDETW